MQIRKLTVWDYDELLEKLNTTFGHKNTREVALSNFRKKKQLSKMDIFSSMMR